MRFGPVPVREALGAVAAHSVRVGDSILRKGSLISESDVLALQEAGIAKIVVAKLEAGDIGENEAAARLAARLAGPGLRTEAPFTGRVNLFAEHAGVFTVETPAIDRLNSVDEAITVATLPAFRAVAAGEMVATVKIIPYGISESRIAQATEGLAAHAPLAVAPYRPHQIGVISTLLPGLKPTVIDKTLNVMRSRIAPAGATLSSDVRVRHEIEALAEALEHAAKSADEIVVVFGASAITDRRDVIPAALERAGGTVEHLGIPVDPGNLLMIGRLAGKPVIGAPGCARSPKENGFDWVLQRILAGLPVTRSELQAMGVGGLLMEIVSRPQPRAPGHLASPSPVAAILLAAGRSSRMGPVNKLRQLWQDKPLIRHAAEAALASAARPLIVVTGHDAEGVASDLAGLDVVIVHNPDYAAGLATSLRAGVAAVPPGASGAVVLLGDMPRVTGETVDRLLATLAESPEALAIVPTVLGQRGNPVLLARSAFPLIERLTGDEGARRLLAAAGDKVVEVPFDDPALALDVDTPEALAALRGA